MPPSLPTAGDLAAHLALGEPDHGRPVVTPRPPRRAARPPAGRRPRCGDPHARARPAGSTRPTCRCGWRRPARSPRPGPARTSPAACAAPRPSAPGRRPGSGTSSRWPPPGAGRPWPGPAALVTACCSAMPDVEDPVREGRGERGQAGRVQHRRGDRDDVASAARRCATHLVAEHPARSDVAARLAASRRRAPGAGGPRRSARPAGSRGPSGDHVHEHRAAEVPWPGAARSPPPARRGRRSGRRTSGRGPRTSPAAAGRP